MEILDFDDRYMYLGSETSPPCFMISHRQNIRPIYPIEYKHYYYYRENLLEHEDEMKSKYNSRAIQPALGNDMVYIGALRLLISTSLILSVLI